MPTTPIPQDASDGLRHQADRIGEVDEERVRSAPFDDVGDVRDDGHRPKGEADSPGAGRLLPDGPCLDRDGLVDQAAGDAADPDRAVDDVGAIDGVLEQRRRAVRDGRGPGFIHPTHDGLDAGQAPGIDVVQDDLVIAGPCLAARDRPIDDRRPEPTPTEDRELHRSRLNQT